MKAIEIGIHSVGMNPMGSTIPCFDAFAVSLLCIHNRNGIAAQVRHIEPAPSPLTASVTGSAPK